MQTEIMMAGFGGQGILFAGQLLAYAALDNGLEVTWMPSYGPEMRGGTANCTVIIADEEIGAPTVRNPRAVMAFNLPSLDKYEPLVAVGGVLVVNQSLVNREIVRNDIEHVMIPANEIAEKIGNLRLANMIMMGAMLEKLPVLSRQAILRSLENHLPARHKHLLPMNAQALEEGAKFAQKMAVGLG